MNVGELQILLGFSVQKNSMAVAQRAIGGLTRMAFGLATALGVGKLGASMISFNSRVEDARLGLASMYALAKGTGVSDQLAMAAEQYDLIRKRASELPGSTEEYVSAMGRLIYPLTQAGFSLEKIRELTVNTVVGAKGLGITSVAASLRDIQQGLAGRFSSTDLFLKSLLEPMGYEGEAGRAKFKALSKERRAEVLNDALTQKAIVDAAHLQAKTFTGQLDKVKEQTIQFVGRIGLPLFTALGKAIARANVWLEANAASVQRVADSVGGVLAVAFEGLSHAIGWLIEHDDAATAMIYGLAGALVFLAGRATVAWLATMGPLATMVGIISGAVYLFTQLRGKIGDVGAAIVAAGAGVAALFAIGKLDKMIKGMRTLVGLVRNYGTATITSGGLGAIQAANNQRAMMGMHGGFNAANMAAGAAATPMGAGAGATSSTAAKAGGGGVMAALGPVGWTLMGAKLLSDATGGDFIDQAQAKGYEGDDLFASMRHLYEASVNVPGNGNTTTTTNNIITVASPNVVMNVADGTEAGEKMVAAYDERMAASLRAANRATAGNR